MIVPISPDFACPVCGCYTGGDLCEFDRLFAVIENLRHDFEEAS